MDSTPLNAIFSGLGLLCKLISRNIKKSNLHLAPQLLFLPTFISTTWNKWKSPEKLATASSDDGCTVREELSRGELDTVMNRIGLRCNLTCGDIIGASEISSLFGSDEIGMDEAKDAFDVFDEKGDGFIDAEELRGVLCNLGQEEMAELEACEKMVAAFDENGDGLVDFNEFKRVLEKCLC